MNELITRFNRLQKRIGKPVEIVTFGQAISFRYAGHEYWLYANGTVHESVDGKVCITRFSEWVEDLINGKVRNDSGVRT